MEIVDVRGHRQSDKAFYSRLNYSTQSVLKAPLFSLQAVSRDKLLKEYEKRGKEYVFYYSRVSILLRSFDAHQENLQLPMVQGHISSIDVLPLYISLCVSAFFLPPFPSFGLYILRLFNWSAKTCTLSFSLVATLRVVQCNAWVMFVSLSVKNFSFFRFQIKEFVYASK